MSSNQIVIKMHLIKHANKSLPSDAKENNENEQLDLANAKDKIKEGKYNAYEACKLALAKYSDDGRPLKDDSD